MNGISLRITTLTFATAMLLAGCGKKEAIAPPAQPPPTPPVPPVVQVVKTPPKEAPIITVIATLDGSTNIEIHTRIGGYLIRQDYQEGASVKQGDLLFEMDARPFQAALEKAKADLTDKQAHSATQAQIETARVSVKTALSNLEDTKIVAPSDGIAGGAVPGLGDLIPPGALLTTLFRVDPIKAVFALPRKYYLDNQDRIDRVLALAPEARPETLELLLPDGTSYSHKGKWDSIERPAPASKAPITASALFPNPDRALRPDEYVQVRVANP